MANNNFMVAVPVVALPDFKAQCLAAAQEAEVTLAPVPEEGVLGNGEVWRLKGYVVGHSIVVSAYHSGKVNFFGLNPKRIGLEVKVIKRWA